MTPIVTVGRDLTGRTALFVDHAGGSLIIPVTPIEAERLASDLNAHAEEDRR